MRALCDGERKVIGLASSAVRTIEGSLPPELSLLQHLLCLELSGTAVFEEETTLDRFLPLQTPNSLSALETLRISGCDLGGVIPFLPLDF